MLYLSFDLFEFLLLFLDFILVQIKNAKIINMYLGALERIIHANLIFDAKYTNRCNSVYSVQLEINKKISDSRHYLWQMSDLGLF